jgi:hypothetical protein
MDLSRLNQAEKIAGAAGIALLIVMFLPWYGVGGFNVDAWEAFSYTDLILFLTAVAAISLALVAANDSDVGLPVALSSVVAGLGALATLLVLFRIFNTPGEGNVDVGRQIGIFLGLIACGAITYAGYLGMQEEGGAPLR